MSKTHTARIILLVAMGGAILAFVLRPRAPHPPEVGEAAPDFDLPGLSQGPIALHQYRHHVVVLNFWATWCPPCVEETPGLERFAAAVQDLGVIVIGVSVDEDANTLADFVARYHLSYPLARDPTQATAARYGTFKFPETFIIDGDGKVAEKIIGAFDWQDPRILTFVRGLARAGAHSDQSVKAERAGFRRAPETVLALPGVSSRPPRLRGVGKGSPPYR